MNTTKRSGRTPPEPDIMSSSFFSPFEQILRPIAEALYASSGRPCLTGVQSSSLAFALTMLTRTFDQEPRPKNRQPPQYSPSAQKKGWLIVVPSDEEAERLYEDLRFFCTIVGLEEERLALFPQWGAPPYCSIPTDVIAQRVGTLHRLIEREATTVIIPVQAAIQRLLPFSVFSKARCLLKVGTSIEREPLIVNFLRLGYHQGSVVESPGEFSIRGGILDIFSTAYAKPLRIEFLGDTVESIRFFDSSTQESVEKLEQAWLLPAREVLAPLENPLTAPPRQPSDAEWLTPGLFPEMHTIMEYFLTPPIVILTNPLSVAQEATTFWNELLEVWDSKRDQSSQSPYPEPNRHFLLWDELLPRFQDGPVLVTDALAPPEGQYQPVVTFPFQTPISIGLGLRGTSFSDTLSKLEQLRENGLVFVIARTQGQLGRLLALFSEHNFSAAEWNPCDRLSTVTQRAPFYLLRGNLTSGLIVGQRQIAFLTEEELFAKGSTYRPQHRSKTATFLSSLEDLNVGDLVVHIQHGISRYQGLRRLEVQGFESDYLILQFAGEDTLYVPLDRLNLVQKYRGTESQTPRLDRLGGSSWSRTTARVKKNIEEMAQELLQLYAHREVVRRPVYSEDSLFTHEFEAGFEYEETPDQLRAIEDIRRDMETPKPMDRLVCGDVGYGKTEVAMRATLKAVQENRQVAVLVPTTLLAQQHFENFSVRFAPFPVRIAMLSRFQNAQEVKRIRNEVSSGAIDVVIGTHRLLQKDLQFKNLGLVVIDEEQWFGVRHKERLKQLRTQVDVLTLTATPIPRTLQMAFSGVRDLSVIDTPPPGRQAIRSQVLRFDSAVIREAIRHELARGGQAYFVHNRVQTMERMAAWLQELVPEARFLMVHGQMSEHVLEGVMFKFLHREADVLVASAIVQSGLDLPHVNTILIDRADTFGLAQLYQLRGRVGRSGQQAYAYLFVPNEETLATDAQKRLAAIQEFANLGSGFRIAAADLEIRGAGNLLGKQQSGSIAAVGLDLYLKMVEHEVQKLKGQQVEEEVDPVLQLNVSAYIPETYVEDSHQRLSLYKRLSGIQQIGDLVLLQAEIQDRFGPIPQAVDHLFEVMQIKVLAKFLQLESLQIKTGAFILTLDSKATISEPAIHWLMDRHEVQFLSQRSVLIKTSETEWPKQSAALQTILQELKQHVTSTTHSEQVVLSSNLS